MNGRLPSLSGLRAFEAAARHLSVTLAAGELNVTPGAVSLQIRDLEQSLSVRLFDRLPRQLRLTEDGEGYFKAMRSAFRLMREATDELLARARPTTLSISCTPTFAAQWLVPRLPNFEERLPGVDIRISASNRLVDFVRDGVDIAIRHGFGRYEGLVSERLLDDNLVPVIAPALRETQPLDEPADLANHILIHDVHRQDWRLWLEAMGVTGIDAMRGPVFTDSNGAIEAAKAGDGVALVRLSLVAREIQERRLVAPFSRGVSTGLAYYIVYPPGALDRPAVTALRQWLTDEARAVRGS
ncbi:MAG TPA: transcriptional regulator GcvA [Shinella sp.]|jgi:LysR family glycine cleavage system transcriptional activator|uniref:transcriptional regulator GcvA n=1 Tax=Shinella sp. TaxID=1870904 RepID=UPI0029B9B97C|nr:transcriptional regulator GcvA [Shinella sp.]MDX3977960.1 transcriptional regulator GcvA [Shinella sp.]HEV7246415.1 transcriptional regulator GcvA [Shinella sp.]